MAKHASSASKIVALIVLIVIGTIFYNVSHLFLPRYRWVSVNFEEIAQKATARGMPTTADKLRTKFDVEFGYYPRGKKPDQDPNPWVLLKMTPAWHEFTGNDDDSEVGIARRAIIISDRTGEPLSGFALGSGQFKDRYFRAKAWRFPPGSLGKSSDRPIILVEAMELEKFDIGAAEVINAALRDPTQWTPDDDGYEPEE